MSSPEVQRRGLRDAHGMLASFVAEARQGNAEQYNRTVRDWVLALFDGIELTEDQLDRIGPNVETLVARLNATAAIALQAHRLATNLDPQRRPAELWLEVTVRSTRDAFRGGTGPASPSRG